MLTHGPYQPTPDTPEFDPQAAGEQAGGVRSHFGDMVAYLDKLVGKLVTRLDELQLRNNTLILFTGDNGTGKGVTSKMGDRVVHGGKGQTTRTGMHVPLIANWPSVIPAGGTCGDLIDGADFLPTLCAAAGIDPPADFSTDGRSFLPQAHGEAGTPREWTYCWYSQDGSDALAREFAADARYKLYRTGELYDYEADADEKHPLAAPLPPPAADAKQKLHAALERFTDARPKALRRQLRKKRRRKIDARFPPSHRMRERNVRFLLPTALLAVLPCAAAAKPNVLIVMTDDQGLGDFSFTGNPVLKTPNFDAFARRVGAASPTSTSARCAARRAGNCSPAWRRCATGPRPSPPAARSCGPACPRWPKLFAAGGLQDRPVRQVAPRRLVPAPARSTRGSRRASTTSAGGSCNRTPEFDWPLIDGRYFHNGVEKRYKGHCTDFWFDSAMAWMKERKAEGRAVPLLPADERPARPARRPGRVRQALSQGKGPAGFFGMIAHIDKRFGDLEAFLADEKLKDDTIVIFMTDNGGTAGVATFNAGLRAGKTTYYDGGHRVPCWIRWPNGNLGDPRDIDTPTQNTDLFPTLCELCGVPPPKRDRRRRPVPRRQPRRAAARNGDRRSPTASSWCSTARLPRSSSRA